MSDKDPPANPFAAFESDRTIIKPSAGRGPRPATANSRRAGPVCTAAGTWTGGFSAMGSAPASG